MLEMAGCKKRLCNNIIMHISYGVKIMQFAEFF